MRGDYSMTPLEFVLTGFAIGLGLVVFITLPDWLMGWVLAVLAVFAFVMILVDALKHWRVR